MTAQVLLYFVLAAKQILMLVLGYGIGKFIEANERPNKEQILFAVGVVFLALVVVFCSDLSITIHLARQIGLYDNN